MRYILLALACWLGGSGSSSAAPLAQRTWTIDGVERQALVHVPAKASEEPSPVVFAFHGHGGNMNNAARMFGYETLWPEAIVVYMQGLKTPGRLTDPEGKKNGWQHGAGDQGDRDLKFFDAALASLKEDYQVEETRIYATGHSNGGGFTYLLWAKRGEVFAAVAPSGSVATKYVGDLKPKPALHVAGENDPLVKFAWQKAGIDAVKRINGCDQKGQPWDKAGSLVGTAYPSKTGTPFVSLISPGNHKFPSEAPTLIVKFFKQHAKM
ncbi:MAG: prolyl oligopeptidase family serine peptidase [Planctomycetaceae bacterium]|nr:prolyl oligopeptidase family serine peptidase [Planctomycetaceae bacterium]